MFVTFFSAEFLMYSHQCPDFTFISTCLRPEQMYRQMCVVRILHPLSAFTSRRKNTLTFLMGAPQWCPAFLVAQLYENTVLN